MSKLVRNEQRKLTANYMNGLAFDPAPGVRLYSGERGPTFIGENCPERVGRMTDFGFLLSYGIVFIGAAAIAAFVLTLDRSEKPGQPAPGE